MPYKIAAHRFRKREKKVAFVFSTRNNNEDLWALLKEVISVELSDCALVVLWDSNFCGTFMLEQLAAIPSPKQVQLIILAYLIYMFFSSAFAKPRNRQ